MILKLDGCKPEASRQLFIRAQSVAVVGRGTTKSALKTEQHVIDTFLILCPGEKQAP
jgi:hypothetical protein